MHPLKLLLAERIRDGLKRKAVTSESRWAETYRQMGQPFAGNYSFDYHPWARAMHDCPDEMMVGQKGAQLGYTEVALNKAFYNIDILGNSVLYVLPTTNDASAFSSSRFDPALELSPHLRKLFSEVKNVGHKRAGSANLFVRGSRGRSGLKSVPVSVAIVDELDEMVQENIALIDERMSGQLTKQMFLLSTPTIEHYGINAYYEQSSQDHWFFPCPLCSRRTELTFPECLVITADSWSDPGITDSHLICKECKGVLSHENKRDYLSRGHWVAGRTDCNIRGFHISQLYSSTVKPSALALSFLKGQTSPSDEQEFYNSKLGLPHEPEGSRISDADIHSCTAGYKMVPNASPASLVTMGVDVGKVLHYEITAYSVDKNNPDVSLASKGKILKVGKLLHFEELDAKMKDYGVNYCVIDANPETRKAREFAQRFWGRVRLCYYAHGVSGKAINIHPQEQHSIAVDRTVWLDISMGRLKQRRIALPVDLPIEYQDHLKALVRITKKDASGNPVGSYKNTGEDHYAHARNYNEIALKLAASYAQSSNIGHIF